MTWFALHETATGRLESIGEIVDDDAVAARGLTKVALAGKPLLKGVMWDPVTRTFVPRPAKVLIDRLEDIKTDADFKAFWDGLNPAQQTKMRDFFIRFLGALRFRNAAWRADSLDAE
jgi:hypothetical protein